MRSPYQVPYSGAQSAACDAHAEDDAPTWDPGTARAVSNPHRTLVLTIVAHPELRRLGQRARLDALLIRQAVPLSRTAPHFSADAEPGAPLADVSVSRAALVFAAGDGAGCVRLEPNGSRVQVDGVPARASLQLGPQRIASGVLLRLSSRVALLLHYQGEPMSARPIDGLVGASEAMLRLRSQIALAASSRAPVLILGESGTGKELVAQAIHRRSGCSGPIVPVNMATLSAGTAGSHLFGHLKGAFTGADARHTGFFEQAQGGSLFLDEIADATPDVQAMLLRALESSTVRPLGADKERAFDARVLAATERDVLDGIGPSSLRPALAQRLAGLVVRVPPLRERHEDIPSLLLHFITSLDGPREREPLRTSIEDSEARLPADFMLRLLTHTFPGNVRELRNIAQQIVALGRAPDTFQPLARSAPEEGARSRFDVELPAPASLAKEALELALAAHDWSPARAARSLGIPNSTVHHWIKRHALVRRAADVPDAELHTAAQQFGGDVAAMAKALHVSARGLRLRLARDPCTAAARSSAPRGT